MIDPLLASLRGLAETGGPVILVLLAVSVLTTALVLYKIWQFRAARVGRHHGLIAALEAWEQGDHSQTEIRLNQSNSYLVPVVHMAVQHASDPAFSDRADAEAETRLSQLERGLGALDMVAQLSPLVGLFGTVLGMIEAFRALQNAGSAVDPSLLAGGIWVALLTTAAGLAVAMPTSLILSWLTGRMEQERVFANRALRTVFAPNTQSAPQQERPVHAA